MAIPIVRIYSVRHHIDNGRHYTLGHDRRKVRMGRELHSQTLGVRVWIRETRVGILRYFLAVSGFVIASSLCLYYVI